MRTRRCFPEDSAASPTIRNGPTENSGGKTGEKKQQNESQEGVEKCPAPASKSLRGRPAVFHRTANDPGDATLLLDDYKCMLGEFFPALSHDPSDGGGVGVMNRCRSSTVNLCRNLQVGLELLHQHLDGSHLDQGRKELRLFPSW